MQDNYQDQQNDDRYEENRAKKSNRQSREGRFREPVESKQDRNENEHYFSNDHSPELDRKQNYNTNNARPDEFDEDA